MQKSTFENTLSVRNKMEKNLIHHSNKYYNVPMTNLTIKVQNLYEQNYNKRQNKDSTHSISEGKEKKQ